MIKYATVIKKLFAVVPEFLQYPGFDSGNQDLPHVVFGDLTRFIINEYCKGRVQKNSPFQRALAFLEQAAQSSDKNVQNLVGCSFLENLHNAGRDYAGIRAKLPRTLRVMLAEMEAWGF